MIQAGTVVQKTTMDIRPHKHKRAEQPHEVGDGGHQPRDGSATFEVRAHIFHQPAKREADDSHQQDINADSHVVKRLQIHQTTVHCANILLSVITIGAS